MHTVCTHHVNCIAGSWCLKLPAVPLRRLGLLGIKTTLKLVFPSEGSCTRLLSFSCQLPSPGKPFQHSYYKAEQRRTKHLPVPGAITTTLPPVVLNYIQEKPTNKQTEPGSLWWPRQPQAFTTQAEAGTRSTALASLHPPFALKSGYDLCLWWGDH